MLVFLAGHVELCPRVFALHDASLSYNSYYDKNTTIKETDVPSTKLVNCHQAMLRLDCIAWHCVKLNGLEWNGMALRVITLRVRVVLV